MNKCLWDNTKYLTLTLLESQKVGRNNAVHKKIFEQITAVNFSNLTQDINVQFKNLGKP